jgi:hypothetical protein
VREGIQPKHSVTYHANDDEPWNAAEWQRVVAAPGSVFDGTNKSLDVRDVLVLRTKVEFNADELSLQRLKLWITMHAGHLESAAIVLLTHPLQGRNNRRHLSVRQWLHSPKV